MLNRGGILYPVLLGDEEIAKDYRVQVVPSIFIIDKNGYIRKRREGYQEISELEGAIEVLLRAPQTSAKVVRELSPQGGY